MGFLVGLAIFWFVMGLFGAWVAARKHRDEGEDFVLGRLFGPLGVLIEALLPVRQPPDPAVVRQRQAPVQVWEQAQRQAQAGQEYEERERAKQIARREARHLERIKREWQRQGYDAMLAARGLERGPLLWLWLLPDWLQLIVIGLMVASPAVIVMAYLFS